VQQLLPTKTNIVISLKLIMREVIKFETIITNSLYNLRLNTQFPTSCALKLMLPNHQHTLKMGTEFTKRRITTS